MAILALLFTTGVAEAQDRDWYVGAKVGQGDVELRGLDSTLQGGVLVGYRFLEGDFGSVAVEGEYTTTVSEGDLDIGSFHGEWELDTLAIFGVYRSAGDFYVKGRVGYLDADLDGQGFSVISGPGILGGGDSEAAAGLGVGWRISPNIALELEWTRAFFDEELDLLMLGVNF